MTSMRSLWAPKGHPEEIDIKNWGGQWRYLGCAIRIRLFVVVSPALGTDSKRGKQFIIMAFFSVCHTFVGIAPVQRIFYQKEFNHKK